MTRRLDRAERAASLIAACGLALTAAVCGAGALFADGFESPPGPACVDQPAVVTTWQRAWSSPNGRVQATYPDSIGVPVPIGASKSIPTAIQWTPRGDEAVVIFFEPVQSNPGLGYPKPRPAISMTLAISECRGHFDVPPECVVSANTGSVFWHATGADVPRVCRVEPGKPYYLNIRADQCADVPNAAAGCDVQAIHRSVL